MAYAGNIIIQTKLDNKEFNKDLEKLNKKIAKLKIDGFKAMRKELNLCQNALKKMSENMASFTKNYKTLNSSKLKTLGENAQKASNYTGSLDRNLKTLINRLNSLNVNNIAQLKADLKSLSNLNFNNLNNAVNNVNKLKSAKCALGISSNVKGALSLSDTGIQGYKENIKGGLSLGDLQGMAKGLGTQELQMTLFSMSDIKAQLKNTMTSMFMFTANTAKKIISTFLNMSKRLVKIFADFTSKTLTTVKNWGSKLHNHIKKISQSFKSMLYALGVDLSFTGFVRGIKNAITEMQGLQSSTYGLMKLLGDKESIDNAFAFIDEYVDDGLVSMQDAITQYKNYITKGFSQDVVKDLMIQSKDVAVVNRKTGADLGASLVNLSEGIKLDLSRSMDMSGLSKNLSDVYGDFAKKIGKESSTALTDKEKLKAIADYYAEIGEVYEGSAKVISKTFIGTIGKLKTQTKQLFAELGNTVGVVLKPILIDITNIFKDWENKLKSINTYINDMVDRINNKIISNDIMANLFGITKEDMDEFKGNKDTVLEGVQDLRKEGNFDSNGVSNLTEDLEEAEKAAKRVLAPFDTINKLEFNTNEDSEEDNKIGLDSAKDTEEEAKETVYWLDYLKLAVKKFIESLNLDLSPLRNSWSTLKTTLFGENGEGFEQGFSNIINNVLKPFIKFFMESFLPNIVNAVDIIVNSFKNSGIDLEPLKKSFKDFWKVIYGEEGENFENTISLLFNEIIVPFISWLVEWALPRVLSILTRVFQFIQEYGPYILIAVQSLWEFLEPVLNWIYNKIIEIFDDLNNKTPQEKENLAKLLVVVTAIGTAFMLLGPIITTIFNIILGLVNFLTTNPIGVLLMNGIKSVGTWITGTAIPWLSTVLLPKVFSIVVSALSTLIGKIIGVIGGFLFGKLIGEMLGKFIASFEGWGKDFLISYYNFFKPIEDAWYKLKETIKNVWESIKEFLSNFDLFGAIGNQFDKITDKAQEVWNKITGNNNIGSTSNPLDGYYGYTSPYLRAATTSYTVPAYANGVVLPANSPRLAIVGDQKQGTSIETQISTMMEAMQRVLSQNQNGQVIQNVLKVDGQVLYKSNNKVSRQRGAKMISR